MTVAITVTKGSDCAWTAVANDSFISISGASSGTGNANVVLAVAANSAAATRTGSASIAGQTVTISQQAAAAAECRFEVRPKSMSLPVDGGTATFTVTMTSGVACGWTARLAGADMTILSGASGTGSGTVVVSVGPNPGTARTNGVIIAEQLVTIFQPERPGVCVLSINPKQFSVSNAAQTVAFDVTITTGSPSFCSWSAGRLGSSVSSTASRRARLQRRR